MSKKISYEEQVSNKKLDGFLAGKVDRDKDGEFDFKKNDLIDEQEVDDSER